MPFLNNSDAITIQTALSKAAASYAANAGDTWEFSMIPADLWPYLTASVISALNASHAAPAGNPP
jgi:hypothetical protein